MKDKKLKKEKDNKRKSESVNEGKPIKSETLNEDHVDGSPYKSDKKDRKRRHSNKDGSRDKTESNQLAASPEKRKKKDKKTLTEPTALNTEITAETETQVKSKKKKRKKTKTDNSSIDTMEDGDSELTNKKLDSENENTEMPQKKKKKKKTKDKQETDANISSDINTVSDVDGEKVKKPPKREKKKKDIKKKPPGKGEEEVKKVSTVVDDALQYIRLWSTAREKWSFQKVRQVWLLKHLYDMDKLPDSDFAIMLEYMEALKGKARELTLQQAEKMVEEYDEEDDKEEEEEEKKEEKKEEEDGEKDKVVKKGGAKLTDEQFERVRQVVQLLN